MSSLNKVIIVILYKHSIYNKFLQFLCKERTRVDN